MEENILILVDEHDNKIGYGEKLDVHQKGQLHRAFSVFIFDKDTNKMLLQRRALHKYHSGGLWTNACCSHMLKDKAVENVINQRLFEELGIQTNLQIVGDFSFQSDVLYFCGKFQYFANFGSLSEHEIDAVYLYYDSFAEEMLQPNPQEIATLQWISLDNLQTWMKEKPSDFTAWFSQAFQLAYTKLVQLEKKINENYVK